MVMRWSRSSRATWRERRSSLRVRARFLHVGVIGATGQGLHCRSTTAERVTRLRLARGSLIRPIISTGSERFRRSRHGALTSDNARRSGSSKDTR